MEVLIAFIIAGLAIAALMRAGGVGLETSRTATRYGEAVSRAQSHLAAATRGAALVAGDTQGDDGGGFHWRLRITPEASTRIRGAGPASRAAVAVTLYAVTVSISWHDGRRAREVRLDSAQLAAGPS